MVNSSMSRVVHLLVFATLFAAQVICADNDVREPVERRNPQEYATRKRVFGGQQAKPGEYKALVFIKSRFSYRDMGRRTNWEIVQCTGSIVSPRWVLTAAHCLPTPYLYTYCFPNQDGRYSGIKLTITVTAGSVDLFNKKQVKAVTLSPSDPPVYQVDIIVHENAVTFQKGDPKLPRYFCDVTLLKMAAEFPVNYVIAPVALMKGPMPEMFPKNCVVLGFGRQDERAPDGKLYYVSVKAGGPEFCTNITKVKRQYDRFFICVHNTVDKRGMACVGDSGSPLLCGNPGTQVVAAGVLSKYISKTDCGDETEGTIYSYTGMIEEWVKNVTNNEVTFKPLPMMYTAAKMRSDHQAKDDFGGSPENGLQRPVAHLPPMILATVMLFVLCK